jgi:enoyl-CoA hydratase
MTYDTLLIDIDGPVAVITLNRPEALNALNDKLCNELGDALDAMEANPAIGCVILTGQGKAFAAGADIKEMRVQSYMDAYGNDFITRNWERTATFRKPIIAAVNGFALGGGCELAMMCDFILASEAAKFGQPEINLGVMPGAGGTQRLTRFVGKSKAMEMCLTGRMMDAAEAERSGLASRVVAADKLMDEAKSVARKIASQSRPIAMMTLQQGVKFERRLFHSMFATNDQKEGMAAFVEKRPAKFSNS